MTSIASRPMTIDEFLALPEREEPPYVEFLRGEVTEKPMPTRLHSIIAAELTIEIGLHLRQTGEGQAAVEMRHAARDLDWVFLPDVNVVVEPPLETEAHSSDPAEGAPVFAVEILSPGDRVGRWLERVELYMAAGTQLLWVVDPADETIVVCRPGAAAKRFGAGDVLDAEPVLHGFALDVANFFARVYRRKA